MASPVVGPSTDASERRPGPRLSLQVFILFLGLMLWTIWPSPRLYEVATFEEFRGLRKLARVTQSDVIVCEKQHIVLLLVNGHGI